MLPIGEEWRQRTYLEKQYKFKEDCYGNYFFLRKKHSFSISKRNKKVQFHFQKLVKDHICLQRKKKVESDPPKDQGKYGT